MVARRYLAALMLTATLLISTAAAAPATADPPAPVSAPSAYTPMPSLSDRYRWDDLVYYTEPGGWTPEGMKRGMQGQVSDLLGAIHGFFALIVQMVIRALDLAWNFNLSRFLSGAIDSVAARFSQVVWGFGGAAFAIAALWTAVQVWNNAYNRLTAGVLVMVGVMSLGIMVSTGPSRVLAELEDVSTDMAAAILAPPGGTSQTVGSMTDAIYQQLILEPWARANFRDLEVAKLKYSRDGVAGAALWHLSEDRVEAEWKAAVAEQRKADLQPWYDNPIGRRMGTLFQTLLSIICVLPMTAVLAIIVLGAKLFTLSMGSLLPVAVFAAFLPVWRGVNFLKGYVVWMCFGPIIKVAGSFGLASWMALAGGLMDSAPSIPGGAWTVSLILGAFTFLMFKMAKPLFRFFGGLVFRTEVEKVAEKAAARSTVEETTERLSYRRAEGARVMVANPFGQQRQTNLPVLLGNPGPGAGPTGAGAFAGQRATIEALEIQRRTIHRLSDAIPAQAAKAAAGAPERRGLHPMATLPVVRQAAKRTEPRPALPELSMVDLIREAKKLVSSMASAAKSGGR